MTRRISRRPSLLPLRDDQRTPPVETLSRRRRGPKGAENGEQGGEHLAAPPRPPNVSVTRGSTNSRAMSSSSTRAQTYTAPNELRGVTRRVRRRLCRPRHRCRWGRRGNHARATPGARIAPPRPPFKGRSRHHSRVGVGGKFGRLCSEKRVHARRYQRANSRTWNEKIRTPDRASDRRAGRYKPCVCVHGLAAGVRGLFTMPDPARPQDLVACGASSPLTFLQSGSPGPSWRPEHVAPRKPSPKNASRLSCGRVTGFNLTERDATLVQLKTVIGVTNTGGRTPSALVAEDRFGIVNLRAD